MFLGQEIKKTRVPDKELTKAGKRLRKSRFEERELEGKVCCLVLDLDCVNWN